MESAKSRALVLRHTKRNKAHSSDKQTLTLLGEILAFVMGIICRQFNLNLVSWGSSEQPRATRTGWRFLQGLALPWELVTFQPTIEPGLNDFGSDQREEVASGVRVAKNFAQLHSVTAEMGVFITSAGQTALEIKTKELLFVLERYSSLQGDHLLTVHGASVDNALLTLRRQFFPETLNGMGGNEGQLGYVEGFLASYEDNILTSIETVRQPKWLKALSMLID